MKRAGMFAAWAVMLAASAQVSSAQPPAAAQRPQVAAPRRERAAGDVSEDFELDIAERRITEADFFASTSVGGRAGEVNLRVGVALGAERIDVLLRNVRGRVRFRGSLDALRRVFDAHRTVAADAPVRRDVP